MKPQDDLKKNLLKENWNLLLSSIQTLNLSLEKVIRIGKKNNYSFEELESFDSLTSKFSRSSDIYTQKVIRSVWELLHEEHVSFIDMMNRAEKLGIIESTDKLLEIRDTRNQIAHEYLPQSIPNLVLDVIQLSEYLKQNINTTTQFLNN